MTWCDRFSLSYRSGRFEYTQADSTISANRPRLWKCVRARVLTSRREDVMWMTQMKAFLPPVPLNVGPSVESRGMLFTVARQHFQSKIFRWKTCARKVTFQDVSVNTIVVVVDDQPVHTYHVQADEKWS